MRPATHELDDRKAYVVKIIEAYFQCTREEEMGILEANELTDFLDDPTCRILCLRRREDAGIILDRYVIFEEDDDLAVVFHKVTPEAITVETMRQRICVLNLLESPVSTLHFSLSQVFKPTIHDSQFWSRRLNPKLQQCMIELTDGLSALMHKKNSALSKAKGVFTVDDEIEVWAEVEKSVSSAKEGKIVKGVLSVIKEIGRELHQCIDARSGTDVFDGILISLQDMWRLGEDSYPQDRLIQFLDLIGTQVVHIVQNGIKGVKVWTDCYNEVENQLNWGVAMCTKMNEISLKCTKNLWPNFDPTWRRYTLSEYVPIATSRYVLRLKEICRIRSIHRQFTILVSVSECKTLNPKDSFAPFKGINIFFINAQTEQEFKNAVTAFELSLIPAEVILSTNMRARFDRRMSHFQLMLEFRRYQDVIERPKISHDIQSQREQLLLVFKKAIEDYNGAIDSGEYENLGGTHSAHINNIYNLRQIYCKVKEIDDMSARTLSDLRDYKTLKTQMTELFAGIEKLENSIFGQWKLNVKGNVVEEGLALRNGTPVIDFNDETRFMEVNYSMKFHALIEDVNQLTLLGFRLPDEVNTIIQKAALFVKQANELDQIASFHNTIGDRMIPCQRPLMLDTAVALSKLVSSQNNVSWSTLREVESYIANFQKLVHCLSRQNNQLSQLHNDVKTKVDLLFDLDIVTDIVTWKNVLGDIRKIFNVVEEEGYRGLKSWRHHWDVQIYKALEIGYIKGLKVIDTKLPPIAVELVYRQQRLQFKPAIEEAKSKYYSLIQKFLALPLSFQGVSKESQGNTIFGNIAKINSAMFRDIYVRGIATIKQVIQSREKYEEWVAIDSIDMKVTCDQFLYSGEDWDLNFKVCRGNVIEIGRLPFADHTILPFHVSSKLLRIEVEALNRKYFDVLGDSILTTTHTELQELQKFLSDGIKMLRLIPVDPDEICVMDAVRQDLSKAHISLQRARDAIESKNDVLVRWVRTRVDLGQADRMMTHFAELLEEQKHVICRQIDTIRGQLESECTQLYNSIARFKNQWDRLKEKGNEEKSQLGEVIKFIQDQENEWKEIKTSRERIIHISKKLNIEVAIPVAIEEIEREIKLFDSIWRKIENFNNALKIFQNENWIAFRNSHYRFDEFLKNWRAELHSSVESPLVFSVIAEIDSYRKLIPYLKHVRGDSFTEKHWTELFHLLKITPRPSCDLTLGDFLHTRHAIETNFKELKNLNQKAAGEITVRQALDELDSWETESRYTFVENMDSQNKSVRIIHDFRSVLNKLGDNQSLLQSIKSSPYFNRFADQINTWEAKLTDLDLFLTSLSKVQRRWIYLEPVFSHGVLDTEQARFKRIDKDFRGILDSLFQDNHVSTLHRIHGIRALLANMLEQLARCQSCLNDFLEKKRSGFPRFYFLGDDDLLEILGQATKPSVIQSHLKKLFGGIHNVEFDDVFENITAMKSQEGEVVELKRNVKITSNVEVWLSKLSQEMKMTLKSLTLECMSQKKTEKRDPDMYPSQILTLCNSISFTGRCEEGIRSTQLSVFLTELQGELKSYTDVTINKDNSNTKVLELKLKDLILDLIHQISIVEYLISEKTKNVTDFGWQKQLRFYVKEDGDVSVRMADAEFCYSYEYQGNVPKLVNTPLTSKCYLTLTQGMRIGLGGNPFGPAGTGKTESVKALGALLGRQVLVFNCDEGIDVKAMGRIFTGLVKCGAWGCFDEFNRLDGATLSAVSMQIQPIQSALKNNEKSVRVLDETVPLDPNAGIFVTLNPAGKGYGGRNELPDNLKQLFRPVAMSSPNNDLIAQVILYTEGFHCAKKLGDKLVEVFNLANALLTPQKHYDWGLRALKTVLKGCGNTLRNFKERGVEATEQDEIDIVVSALRLNTLPKLPFYDVMRFNSLIKDLFGDVVFKELGHQLLEDNIRACFAELKLHVNENQVRKCLQLYEQLEQRMGVVIVGPPCSGKSTIRSVLKHALIRMKEMVKTYTINPKAMLKAQLLGHINVDTRQWSDGVLTLKAQEVYNETEDVRSWIICDGDIDPEWIESLNSVLDDNRLLTLPSGWRIKFGPNVNFIFETHDLTYASPATISRVGMILTSDEDADVNGVISSWLESQPTNTRQKTAGLIKDYFHKGLKWVGESSVEGVGKPPPLFSIVKNGLSHMAGVVSIPEMIIAMMRGLGCQLGKETKLEFIKTILGWTDFRVEGALQNLTYDQMSGSIESFDDEDVHDPSQGVKVDNPPLVKTANVKMTLAHIKPWMLNAESFLLAGTEGCGKTMIIEYAFSEMHDVEIATIHCSSLITPQHVFQKLSQVCISKSSGSGREFIAKSGGRLILYFKDLNLVKPDKWGTCQLVEFLQQIISEQGFYDSNLEWIWLKNVQIVASITVGSSDGRHDISPRFTSNIRFCTVVQPMQEQLMVIYKTYVTLCFKSLHPECKIGKSEAEVGKIVQAMILIYEAVEKSFPRTKQSHYQFTSRDLTNWVFGIMRYDLDTLDTNAQDDFIEIWAYEACRLFRDRLVTADERLTFDEILEGVARRVWNSNDSQTRQKGFYFVSCYALRTISSTMTAASKTVDMTKLSKISKDDFAGIVDKGMLLFAREYRELNVVIFPEVLDNVARFDRILSRPCSSLVLAGRSGIGRRTALSIVAALHGATLYTLKVGQHYEVKQFKNDLKSAIRISAIEGNSVFLVVEDFQLIDEIFLDMLNGLLSSGEVPSLYKPDELETILSSMRDTAADEGNNTSNAHSFFVKRVKELLHVILILDYTNIGFQKNCERNPAVYKQCSLLWLDSWCQDTLMRIPKLIISKFYTNQIEHTPSSERIKREEAESDELMKYFRHIYDSLTSSMASPRRYIAFVHTYGILFTGIRGRISSKIMELKAGVQKLDEARTVVEKLKTDAASQEVIIASKKSETASNWKVISKGMERTAVAELQVKEMKDLTMSKNVQMLVEKQAIDAELDKIQPTLVEAQMSVGNLSNDALIEIRSLRAPPETIKDILEGVLRLMGIVDTTWASMKAFLSRRGVKDDLRNFDAKNISPVYRKAVEEILKERSHSFDRDNARRASRAAAPLAAWVVANVNYSKVLERIAPLIASQAAVDKNIDEAVAKTNELTKEMSTIIAQTTELKRQLDVTSREIAELEIKLENVTKTLRSAQDLVEKLQDEFIRWNEEASRLGIELESLPVKCVLAAAFTTYLSDADETERFNFGNRWISLTNAKAFDFCEFMSTEQELLSFQKLGLPSDRLSQENALIIMQTSLRPYLIDPSSRATEWLKAHLQQNGNPVATVSLRDSKFAHELELAVRFGRALIIHETDEVEPILMPLLRGDFVSHGSRDTIQIGEKSVDYNQDFRLYMTTRKPNPILPPDTAAVVAIVNFTTTRAGLTTQLLSTILSFEKPELEARKSELLKQTDQMKQDLSQLGTQLLKELATATGNILENQELLRSLQQTKRMSTEVNTSLAEMENVEKSLNNEINVYLPLAEFGSNLFFSILDVPKLNRLYKFSLMCFVHLFRKTLSLRQNTEQSTENRIHYLREALERLVYEYVCQSLFKADRLAFALHMAHSVHPEYFQNEEWECYSGQLSHSSVASVEADSVPSWIPEDRQVAVGLLVTHFGELRQKLQLDEETEWQNFMSKTDCENAFPPNVERLLSPFQILLTIQALRPDRQFTAMTNFARIALSRSSLFPPPTSFKEILDDTMAKEPILILVATGADPSQELRDLGVSLLGKENYSEISMGKENLDTVLETIHEAAAAGKWLCLKNLHLVTHWLDSLEKEIQKLTPHKEFRLWLTSEPHFQFPVILAESCLKIAYESPEGLKKNLQRTYTNWPKEYISRDRNILRMQALFALAFFHAVVQERRTYIPQGWSKFYEFNESDLRAGAEVLDNVFKSARGKKVQWTYVRGIYENAIYGGRVDNVYDSRILVSYLNKFFNDDVLTGNVPQRQALAYGIQLPTVENYNEFRKILENFPEYDRPVMFGLPGNIERSWQRATSNVVINQLKTMGREFLEEGQFVAPVWYHDILPVLTTWRKVNSINSTTDMLTQKVSFPTMRSDGNEFDPLEHFVRLEQFSILDFLQEVHKVLGSMSRVGRGTLTPTPQLLNIFNYLRKREVPPDWLKSWDGPQDAKAYVTGLVNKVVSMKEWVSLASDDALLSQPLNLADLLHPINFLSAFKQHCARKQSIRMDELEFVCLWKKSGRMGGGIPSCRLTGLYIEGCTFDGTKLVENTAESAHISKVPDCMIGWMPRESAKELHHGETISTPLYYNETRQNFITCLDLPTDRSHDRWIQAGVALFLKS